MLRHIISILFFLCLFSCKETNIEQAVLESTGSRSFEFKIFSGSENASVPTLDSEDYLNWLTDAENGFKKEKTIGNLVFTIQKKPFEFISLIENRYKPVTGEQLKIKRNELAGLQYYDLKVALNSGEGELLKYSLQSPQEYEERIKYFAFQMQHDIKLVQNGDSLPCTMFHFERTYDVVPFSKFLLAFPETEQSQNQQRTLVIYDRIFNSGIVKFTYDSLSLNSVPKLKTL